VQYYVEEGIKAGGRILVGGTIPNMDAPFTEGAWFAPTVIVDAPATCSLSMEEVFGPVVSVHPFDTDQEAIEIANSVEYGLAATVWTSNLERAHQVSRALDTGMVWVNTWLHRDLRVPFGGVKHSGVGREGGAFSLDFYSHAQNICISLPR
jgi:aminomuconate-semialdehyde/2-hydroxymuconate-6-semialdehyde dehydrogenase